MGEDRVQLLQGYYLAAGHQVFAHIDTADPQPASEGGANAFLGDQRPLGGHRGLGIVERGAGLVIVRLGDRLFLDQFCYPFEFQPREGLFGEQALEFGLVRAVVQFQQQFVLLCGRARMEVYGLDLAANLIAHLDSRDCGKTADHLQIGLPVFQGHMGRGNHRGRGAAGLGSGHLLPLVLFPGENATESDGKCQGDQDDS